MSTPQQGMSFLDAGNQLLGPVPVRLETGAISGPQGKLGVLTLRSATTTMTAMMAEQDLGNWITLLTELKAQLGASKVVAATVFDVAALNQQQQHQQQNGLQKGLPRMPKG